VSLPRRAQAVIAAVLAAAAALIAVLTSAYWNEGFGRPADLVVLTGLVVAAWAWPLIVYRGSASEVVHADEGLLLIALLLLPPLGVMTVLAVAVAVGQLVRRQVLLKAAFNWAEVIVAAAAAVLVVRLAGVTSHGSLSVTDLLIAAAGVASFFVISVFVIAAIQATTTTTSFRAAVLDGSDLQLLVMAVSCVVAAPLAIAGRAAEWAIVLLPPLYFGVRWVLAGRFDARHDRDRLLGLFDATLTVHRPISGSDVRAELTHVASELLRSPDTQLTEVEPAEDELSSRLDVEGTTEWLVLKGRPHSEPLHDADRRLLDALTAVGRSALSHAAMYARVQRQSDELNAIMGGLAEGVVAFDAEAQPVFVNAAGATLLATDPNTLVGDSPESAKDSLVAIVGRCLRAKSSLSDEAAILLRFDGTTFPASYTCAPILEDDEAVGAVLVFRDVSERVAAERQLSHNAFHDHLTGLPNRRLFLDRLDQALLRGQRSGTTHAVLLADIDRFKVLNDNLGQQAGDEILQEIARRIAVVARPSDTIARFGGDEFTVLVEDIQGVGTAQRLAARISYELTQPVQLSEGRQVVVTMSIGIALTEGQPSADDVLHDADVAMSQAKAAGVGAVHCYDSAAMLTRSAHRFDLEADLRTAIANDQMEVYYQPKIDLQQGTMPAVEALIRWPDPQVGLRMPGEFIPVAEESGLILPLGRFVLTEAARQAHVWQAAGIDTSVAVNLSARQFQDHGLIQQIESALRISQLPPYRLCLEITESLAMQDLELTVRTLRQLKSLGVELSIDDFGTGHSSLSYLKRFPVDEVKIDRSFVRDLDSSAVDRAIVAAIVGLADALGMRTVVEGIEDVAQLERVRELGCTLAQGYLVSMPLPAKQVTETLVGRIPSPRKTIDLTTVKTSL
jgi:diguanylate cyclase (GGDEF)-like protein/PAS domain S-box-containing protein